MELPESCHICASNRKIILWGFCPFLLRMLQLNERAEIAEVPIFTGKLANNPIKT